MTTTSGDLRRSSPVAGLEEAELVSTAPEAELELSGAGRNFGWAILSPLVLTVSSFFLLSFSVRQLGAREYGAVVTIGALTSLLTLFTGGLRYAVQRSGAGAEAVDGQDDRASVRAAHSLFCAIALLLVVGAAALGWVVNLDLGLHGAQATKVYVAAVILVAAAAVLVACSAFAGILTTHERFATIAKLTVGGFVLQVAVTVALVPHLRIIGLALASLASSIFQAAFLCRSGRRLAPWLAVRPEPRFHGMLRPVLGYAAGIIFLSFTGVVNSASDAFVIGGLRGGAAVAVFRIGSAAPTSLVGLLYTAFGVLFPRLIRSPTAAAQEEGVGWMGRIVGWLTGIAFAALALLGPDIVRILLGRDDATAVHILWIVSAAMAVDVCFHGVVQVVYARGFQGMLAKYTWIELTTNLVATVALVSLLGPVGSAWAMAATIVVTDVIGFPIIMRPRRRRGRHGPAPVVMWSSLAGRFVARHGIVQMVGSGAIMLGICGFGVAATGGIAVHVAVVAVGSTLTAGVGYRLLGSTSRGRLRGVVGTRRPAGPALAPR